MDEMIEASRRIRDARVPVHLDGGDDLDDPRSGRQRLADVEYAAIEVARALAAECGVGIEYVRSDVYPGQGAVRRRRLTGHDGSPWRRRPDMGDLGGGRWGRPEGAPRLPLLFSLRASRPA